MKKTLLMLMFAAAGSGQEAEPPPLALREAVRLALEKNRTLEASTAAEDAARARIAESRSGMLPKVNYAESWTRSDNPVFVFSSLLSQRQFAEPNFRVSTLNRPDFLNNFQSLVTADQPIYDAGRTKRAVRAAELGRQLAGEDVRRNRLEVIAQVARFYYDAQLSAERLRVTDQALRSAQASLERAEARRAAGMVTDADVLSMRVHLAEVREEQIRRSAELDVARAAVNDAIGIPLDSGHRFTTALTALPIPKLDLGTMEQSAVEARPEVKQTKLAREIAGVQVDDARGNLLPQVTLHGAFEADRQRFYNRGGANWLVSIGLRWNLFNGFADKARIEAGQAELRRSAAEQARAESGIRLEVRRAWAGLRAAQQRIESASASVAEAAESLRISKNRYEAGLATVTDLLRTETALLQVQTRYLAAVHDQRVAAAMLELAAGTLSAESEVLN